MNRRIAKKMAERATLGLSLYFLLSHARPSFFRLTLAEQRHHLRRVGADREHGLGMSRKRSRLVAKFYQGIDPEGARHAE